MKASDHFGRKPIYCIFPYGHSLGSDSLLSMRGDSVRRGDQIATIGNAKGMYYAHLHLEIRKEPGLPLGGGYGKDTTVHFSPTRFIQLHRP